MCVIDENTSQAPLEQLMKKIFHLCIFIIVVSILGSSFVPATLNQLTLNSTALVNTAINKNTNLKLVFGDEFTGSSLNLKRWQTQLMWGRTNPPELQYYTPSALSVNQGALHIVARRKVTNGMPFSSGVISTYKSFQFTYGVVKARIRIPAGKGLWSALWLLDGAGGTNEIDITEMLGNQPNISYMTLHYPWSTAGGYFVGPNFAAKYHVFMVDWSPGIIVWYVDGIQRLRLTKHVPNQPMYLIVNLAVGGDWPGPPNSTTKFPAYYDIDYIRIYKK
jgi:beta-glucanase (GH16 family)